MSEVLVQPNTISPTLAAGRRFQIEAAHLREGMFVMELDRPWIDTPFLLQGFMVDSQIELDTLRRYCTYAYVNEKLSDPSVREFIRACAMGTSEAEGENGPVTQFGVTLIVDAGDTVPQLEPDAAVHPAPGTGASAPTLHGQGHGTPRSAAAAGIPGSADVAQGPPAPADFAVFNVAVDADADASGDAAGEAGSAATTVALPGDSLSGAVGDPDATAGTAMGASTQSAASRRSQRQYRSRADIRISQETRSRFRQMVRQNAYAVPDDDGVVNRVLGWMSRRGGEKGARPSGRSVAAGMLPAGVILVRYVERCRVEEEFARAARAFNEAGQQLAQLCADVRSGRRHEVWPVVDAADALVASAVANPDALALVARVRDESQLPQQQGLKVALYMLAMGRHLGLPAAMLRQLALIGMLADVGKLKLPRALLEKPGMLSPSEFSMIKEHVALSLKLLAGASELPDEVLLGIAQHHERMDGSGYPRGLRESQIGLHGQIAAIADAFSALTTPRLYAVAYSPQEALMSLFEWGGSSFSETMIEQFVQAIGVYPVGSLVELSSGEVAAVIAHNRVRRLEPRVLMLSDADKNPLAMPRSRELLRVTAPDGSKSTRIARGLPSGAFGFRLVEQHFAPAGVEHGSDA